MSHYQSSPYPRTGSKFYPRSSYPVSHEKPKEVSVEHGVSNFSYPSNNKGSSVSKGFHHMVGFGKFGAVTWYEVANRREFNYLKWCSTTDAIQIKDNARPHLHCALNLQADPKATWVEHKEPVTGKPDEYELYYEADIKGDKVQSPRVLMRQCSDCRKDKVAAGFTVNPLNCNRCCNEQFSQFKDFP